MRISLMLLLFSSAAVVLSGCPLSGGDPGQDVSDSVGSDIGSGTPDVEADCSLPDATEENGSSQVSDSATPDLEGSPCIAVSPGELDFAGVQCFHEKALSLTIESCGAVPVELYGVGLAEGPDIDNDGEPNGWFDVPWDCFWFNPDPDWSPPGPEGTPVCPEKDYDYGPESITFAPGEELTYRVGVNGWNDHGYGPSYATVRVYIYGALAFEFADVKLQKLLTWEVCEIEWPSGNVKPILDENGEPNILPPINCGFTGCPPWE